MAKRERVHVWKAWSGKHYLKWKSWCKRTYHRDDEVRVVTIEGGLDDADCLDCLRRIRAHSTGWSAIWAYHGREATKRIERRKGETR